jgi:hypothetical protein
MRGIELPADPPAAFGEFYRLLNDRITEDGRRRGVAMPDLNAVAASDPVAGLEYAFPNYFMLQQFGNMSAYRVRPTGPETCLFELWSLTLRPEGEARERPVVPTPVPHDAEGLPLIPTQDYSNIPRQQRGLHSHSFEYMRLSRDVEGLISNYQRLIDGYIAGRDRESLTRAGWRVSGPYDAPVADIFADA